MGNFQCSMLFYLTNSFQVAMHLLSNRSQMMSKCRKNKKVAQEAIAERVNDETAQKKQFFVLLLVPIHCLH